MSREMLLLGVAGVLGVASIIFSALETAVFSMNASRRHTLRQRDAACAARLDRLLDVTTDAGKVLLVADTLVDLPLIVLCIYLLEAFHLDQNLPGWGIAAVALGVVIVLCDLAPKLVALAAPIRTTRLGMPVARLLVPALGPVCRMFSAWSDRLVSRLLPRDFQAARSLSPEELETLIEIGREEGSLGEAESRIIREVNKLADETARHCMTPRVDAFSVPDDLTNEDAAALVRRRRYRHVPVRGETPDDIVGILDVEKFLLNPAVPYTESLLPPSFVPDTMNALELLQSFLRRRQSLAILVDEFGGIKGLVTLSDLVEELLGEEGPASRNELYIERIGGGRLLANGSARLDDLSEYLGFDAEEEGIETIGGLVTERLGALAKAGSQITMHGWQITVRRATRKRIKEVLIEPISSTDAEESPP